MSLFRKKQPEPKEEPQHPQFWASYCPDCLNEVFDVFDYSIVYRFHMGQAPKPEYCSTHGTIKQVRLLVPFNPHEE